MEWNKRAGRVSRHCSGHFTPAVVTLKTYNPAVAATPARLDAAMAADEQWMRLALRVAENAAEAGEVPIGAVLVVADKQVSTGENRTRRDKSGLAHAELIALAQAQQMLGDFRLDNAVMYVTVEPCLMCLGALHQARLAHVVYGCAEPKFGAFSRFGLEGHPDLRRLSFTSGVLAEESAALLGGFFRTLRGASE
jgi:tRNA(adenine34) deaminase